MSINKGAPLRALSTIAILWIAVRIVWEAIFPSANLQPAMAAKIDASVPRDENAVEPLIPPPAVFDKIALISRKPEPPGDRGQGQARCQKVPSLAVGMSGKWLQQALLVKTQSESSKPPNSTGVGEPISSISPIEVSASKRTAGLSPSSKPLSGYLWAFARQNNGLAQFGAAAPIAQSPGGQYGGSQAGAIVAYRLAGNERRSLSTFVRLSTALSTAGEEELAIGVSAKPFTKLPLSVFAEQRLGAKNFRNRGTSVYVAGGTGPDRLWADFNLETYGQAGFVFADNNSYFFDASATLQRRLWARGDYKVTAGAGIWAGGQEGLTRVDIGPRANLHIPLGKLDTRLSLDWRQRVGGNALPDSGLAVTVATGF